MSAIASHSPLNISCFAPVRRISVRADQLFEMTYHMLVVTLDLLLLIVFLVSHEKKLCVCTYRWWHWSWSLTCFCRCRLPSWLDLQSSRCSARNSPSNHSWGWCCFAAIIIVIIIFHLPIKIYYVLNLLATFCSPSANFIENLMVTW